MKTKKEIQNWILENCVDAVGDISLTNLNFEGRDVYLTKMTAKRIFQSWHNAEFVKQTNHKAKEVEEGYHDCLKIITLKVTPAQHEAIIKIMEETK